MVSHRRRLKLLRIMDETKDPILKEQESISTDGLEYSFVNLPQSTIEVVDVCVRVVWVMGNYRKIVEPRDIIHNVQQIFISEEIKSKNKYWKEHCAASLREIVDNHFEPNCNRFLKCIPKRNLSEEDKKICESLIQYKCFLNDFAHFKKGAIDIAKEILNKQTLKEINEQVFDKICTNFIFLLETFFKFRAK